MDVAEDSWIFFFSMNFASVVRSRRSVAVFFLPLQLGPLRLSSLTLLEPFSILEHLLRGRLRKDLSSSGCYCYRALYSAFLNDISSLRMPIVQFSSAECSGHCDRRICGARPRRRLSCVSVMMYENSHIA